MSIFSFSLAEDLKILLTILYFCISSLKLWTGQQACISHHDSLKLLNSTSEWIQVDSGQPNLVGKWSLQSLRAVGQLLYYRQIYKDETVNSISNTTPELMFS